MAWPKLSMMNNRNGRRTRTTSPMTTRRRSILRMHDLLSKMVASESKRQQKLTARQVMSITKYDTVADPKYLDWLEYPITFIRANQWADIP